MNQNKNNKPKFNNKAYILIVILVIIGVLALLGTSFYFAVKPSEQLAKFNNSKRYKDIIRILNSIQEYRAVHKGELPPGLSEIGDSSVFISKDAADICLYLVPEYLDSLPSDPNSPNKGVNIYCDNADYYNTGYKISIDKLSNEEKITISAPSTEYPLTTNLKVTR